MEFLDAFKDIILPFMSGKKSFPRIKIGNCEFPSVRNHPSLLVHDLPSRATDWSEEAKGVFNLRGASIISLFAPSGSGKTRTVYEILSCHLGLFFTTGDLANGFCADFEKTVDLLDKIRDEKNGYPRRMMLLHNLIASRTWLLHWIKQRYPEWKSDPLFPQRWLLLQVYCREALPEHITVLETILDKLSKGGIVEVPDPTFALDFGVIDEAQELMTLFHGNFASRENQELYLYGGLVKALTNNCNRVISAGTRLRTGESGRISSRPLKFEEVTYFTEFGGFDSTEAMKTYTASLGIRVVDHLWARIGREFRGRYRFLAFLFQLTLNAAIEAKMDEVVLTEDSYESIFQQVTSNPRNPLLTQRSSLYLQFHAQFRELKQPTPSTNASFSVSRQLRNMVLDYCIFGATTAGNVELVERAFCRIKRGSVELNGIIDEPLIALAGWNFLWDSNMILGIAEELEETMTQVRLDPGSLGSTWEKIAPCAFHRFFLDHMQGKTVAESCSDFAAPAPCLANHPIFGTKRIISVKNISSLRCLGRLGSTASSSMQLTDFLTHGETPFFFPENEAGPDLVRILTMEDGTEIVEFFQIKLRKDRTWADAIRVTDPAQMYSAVAVPNVQAELKGRKERLLKYLKGKSILRWIVTSEAATPEDKATYALDPDSTSLTLFVTSLRMVSMGNAMPTF